MYLKVLSIGPSTIHIGSLLLTQVAELLYSLTCAQALYHIHSMCPYMG